MTDVKVSDTGSCKNKEYCKEWYKKNRDKHKQYSLTKLQCECGDMICRIGLTKHKLTNRHFANLYKKMDKPRNKYMEEISNTIDEQNAK